MIEFLGKRGNEAGPLDGLQSPGRATNPELLSSLRGVATGVSLGVGLATILSCASKRTPETSGPINFGESPASALTNQDEYTGPPIALGNHTWDQVVKAMGTPLLDTRPGIKGDSKFGVLHVVGARHSIEITTYNVLDRELTANCQAAVVRHLLERDAKVVMVEGIEGPVAPLTRQENDYISKIFPGHSFPDTLNNQQINYLWRGNNSMLLLRYLKPDVQLIGVDSDSLQALAEANLNAGLNGKPPPIAPDKMADIILNVREASAMKKILAYFNSHLGAEVYVCWGRAHTFESRMAPFGARLPYSDISSFPSLEIQNPDEAPNILRQLSTPELRAEYLARLPFLTPAIFAELNLNEQREVFRSGRTFMYTGDYENLQQLTDSLVAVAHSTDVADSLRAGRFYYQDVYVPDSSDSK